MSGLSPAFIDQYILDLEKEFPGLNVSKDRPWWLRFIFGLPGIKKLEWNNATQAIGRNIYLSDRWDEIGLVYQLSTLRHERQHLIWFRNHTTILASILYLLFIFPVGLAYYRARFERDGYRESLRTRVEYYGSTKNVKRTCQEMYLEAFTGWEYLKMWPFSKIVLRWFEEDWSRATALHQ